MYEGGCFMKKLIILMLVLGLTSVTNAALVLSYNGSTDVTEVDDIVASTDFTIDVYSTTALPDQFVLFVNGPASHSGTGTVYAPPAPAHLGITDYDTYGGNDHVFAGMMSTPDATAGIGKWWDIEFHCDGEGDVVFDLRDSTGNTTVDTLTVHQIPEPMTIALLGLGGLFLRRRK
jgi:hypothetical protein